MRFALGRGSRVPALLLLLFSSALPLQTAHAEDSAVLRNLLRDSGSFRVRARAALALGRDTQHDTRARRTLQRALKDPHAAVRAAAASALTRVGDARSLPALRKARRDRRQHVAERARAAIAAISKRVSTPGRAARGAPREPEATRVQSARYVIVVGRMRNDSGLAGRDLAELLATRVAYESKHLARAAVLRPSEMTAPIKSTIRRRNLPVFRLEGSLQSIAAKRQHGDYRVRAEVSLLLLDEPQRNLRSMLRGAASGIGAGHSAPSAQFRALARMALVSAVRSAMRNAQQAVDAARKRGPKDGMREGPREASLRTTR